MVKTLIEGLSQFCKDAMDYTPPGIFIALATAFLVEGKYFKSYRQEFVGTFLMISLTFSAGKWVGSESMEVAWMSHFLGVIAADYFGGGPHVNPAVTLNMWSLGKINYTEAYIRVAAQMAGGLLAFPVFRIVSDSLNMNPFGGPEFDLDGGHPVEAFLSEFAATTLLMFLIYIVNWEMHFGTYHYWIKQSMTAVGIRVLIEFFPTAGPAMNPMLATAWAVFGVGTTFEFPSEMEHYFVYWIAPGMAAIFAAVLYTIYAGGTVFGVKMPIGPFKKQKVAAQKKKD